MSRKSKQAVVLLSGGLDSTTVLYYAKKQGYRCHCLIVDYGQRHRREVGSAKAIARAAECPVQVVEVAFPWKGSALTNRRVALPKGRSLSRIGCGIPSTYVPARNTIFLSLALGYAEAIGADRIFIGATAVDFSGYPDCRPEYYRAFAEVIRRGTRAGVEGKSIRIETPLIRKTKAQIIQLGIRLGVPYHLTWSCYLGRHLPCGECDSCLLRRKGFSEAGLSDPILLV